MKSIQFPLHQTKTDGVTQKFVLTDPRDREKYFQAKAGFEIEKIKTYLKNNTFVAYLLGKKNAGKGTYTKMFMEIFGEEKVAHVSVGDIVRDVHAMIEEGGGSKLKKYLNENYRGYIPLKEAIDALLGRSTTNLLPTEFILTLIKWEVDKHTGKSIFLDGFPRSLDQVAYSLFFRDLINHRNDPDFFVLIDVPMAVIDERIKTRVVCPICHTPRTLKLNTTPEVGYDQKKKEFYLKCDNPDCRLERMVGKEGDELGIEPIRERLEADENLIEKAFGLYGVPKVFLRNAVPVEKGKEIADDYEITPEYVYHYDAKTEKVTTGQRPYTIKDDRGVDSYSLLPAAVVLSMIRQIAEILD